MLVNSLIANGRNTSFSLNQLLKQRANNIRDHNFKVGAFNSQQKSTNPSKVQSFATMFTKLRKKMRNEIKHLKSRKSSKDQIHSSVLLGKTVRGSFVQENKQHEILALNNKNKVKTVLSESMLDFSNISTIPKLHNLNNKKMSYSFYQQKLCKGSTIGKPTTQNQNRSIPLKRRSLSKTKTQIQQNTQHNFVPLGKVKILSDSQRYIKQVNCDHGYQQNQAEVNYNNGMRNRMIHDEDQQPLKQIYDKIFSKQHPQQTLLSRRRVKNGRKIYASHKLQLKIQKCSKFGSKQQSVSNIDNDIFRERSRREKQRISIEAHDDVGVDDEIKDINLRSPLGPWTQQKL